MKEIKINDIVYEIINIEKVHEDVECLNNCRRCLRCEVGHMNAELCGGGW